MPTIHTLIAPLKANNNNNKPERFYSISVWQ